MDALAALKMMTGPTMGTQMDALVKQSVAQTIPAQDLQTVSPDMGAQAVNSTQSSSPGSFSNLLGNFVGEVNAQQAAAGDSINGLLSGKNVSLHQTMISMEEANVSFQMMVEVRNKLLDSYQELMRMQI
jgi:flagellar hook-basal body complex protein FliE